MKNIEDILDQYRKNAFDPTQPFLQAVFHLTKTYGNDYTLGAKIRELISRFEEADRERIGIELDKQLQQILTDGKN
jgi:hypothetical protein